MSAQPQPFGCLASFEAFWNAPLQEVAHMVLVIGFADRLQSAAPEIRLEEIEYRVAEALPDLNLGMVRDPNAPPLAHLRAVLLEAILLLEHRYLVARHGNIATNLSTTAIRLLRTGRTALESGDPAAALR